MSTLLSRRRLLRDLGLGLAGTITGCGGHEALAASPRLGPRAQAPACGPTGSDILGPYYAAGAPMRAQIAASSEPGERLILAGRVLAPDCATPLTGAVVEVWQADGAGNYYDCPSCPSEGGTDGYRLRGTLATSASGEFELATIVPGRYRLSNGWRPAHIHFRVAAPGYATLTTQLYFAGDPHLAPNDACGSACGSDDAGRTIALRRGSVGQLGEFPIVLSASRS
jgi:catechol 1,2-dioxygenase